MEPSTAPPLLYKRSRFTTRLPVTHRYSASHSWIERRDDGVCRVGLTQFATRMLGDLVEFEFQVSAGSEVRVGQVIGTLEGFKALTDVYCVAQGTFHRSNPDLEEDITLLESEPYGRGWLYEVRGEADQDAGDVHAYVGVLDAIIDKMLAEQGKGPQQ